MIEPLHKKGLINLTISGLIAIGSGACDNSSTPVPNYSIRHPTTVVGPLPPTFPTTTESHRDTLADQELMGIVDRAGQSILQTQLYNERLVESMKTMWVDGLSLPEGDAGLLSLPNGGQIIVKIRPKTEEVRLNGATAFTALNLQTQSVKNGGTVLYIDVQGNIVPGSYDEHSPEMQAYLRGIDIMHESVITLASLMYINEAMRQMGFDTGRSIEEQGITYDQLRVIVDTHNSVFAYGKPYMEAGAELKDAMLLYPLFSGPQQVSFVDGYRERGGVRQPTKWPSIGGIPYRDSGAFYVVHTTIGPQLRPYNSYDQLSSYGSFMNIPGFDAYLTQFKGMYSPAP